MNNNIKNDATTDFSFEYQSAVKAGGWDTTPTFVDTTDALTDFSFEYQCEN